MADNVSLDLNIIDYTDPNRLTGYSGNFQDSVKELLESIYWRVSRESGRNPGCAPIVQKDGKTIEVQRNIIVNGVTRIPDIPASDYLTNDFSVATQLEKLHDISERFIHACIAPRTDEKDWLIWGAAPYVAFSRRLTPTGLLLLLTAQVNWV